MASTRTSKTAKANKPKPQSKPRASAKPTIRKPQATASSPASIDNSQIDTQPASMPNALSAASTTTLLSGLDAAVIVLREARAPLNAQDLVGLMLERGLWKTEGKTPAATIYAAMIREIRSKGSASRFLKADRGRFSAAG